MVTYEKNLPAVDSDYPYIEGSCLSTDTKPTNVANGSIMKEIDTAKLYLFDETAKTWREWS